MVVADVSTVVVAVVIFFTIILMIAKRAKRRRVNGASKTLPGPPQWPLFGNTFFYTKKVDDLIDLFTSLFDSYPSIYQMRVGPSIIVSINDPDLSKTVLVDQKMLDRAFLEMLLKPFAGAGLVTARPAVWRLHRKIVGSAFNSTFLRHFIDAFNSQAKIMAERLAVHQDGPEFDMERYISACMFDIINETAMNVKLGSQAKQDLEFKRAVDSILEISTVRFFKPWLHPQFFFNLSPLGVQYAKCVKIARGFAKRVIEEKMNEIISNRLCTEDVDHEEHADTPSIQGKTLLNLLLDWNNGGVKMQKEEMIDEVITILVTATDTTVTTTNMLMFALACYPDVQEKVYEEVTEVCGIDDGLPITEYQLNKLVYLERVIKETLRLFPVAGILPRDVMEDMTIGEYYVPKGAVVLVAVYGLHKNEKFWPDPLKFDPDRFLPEEVAKRHPYAYMPFGTGPRSCIDFSINNCGCGSAGPITTHLHRVEVSSTPAWSEGARYAMMSMKTICAKVVQKFALEKDHSKKMTDTKMRIGITTKPCDPVTIRIRKRRGKTAKA